MPSLTPSSITKDDFTQILSRYPSTVPSQLHDLDTQRYDAIPALITERSQGKDGAPFLKKDEVLQLVEWKLKHGTFRPKLLQLVQSNDASVVEALTRNAFSSLSTADPLPAVKLLTALKGIGPATASLLLAVASPRCVPFFSDDLFRWVGWDVEGTPAGWGRPIKYNVKEYAEVIKRVQSVVERLGVGAVDVEKVAWVLGREGVDVGVAVEANAVEVEYAAKKAGFEGDEVEEKEAVEKEEKKSSKKEISPPRKTGTKRKAAESIPAVEGTRRNSRRKPDS